MIVKMQEQKSENFNRNCEIWFQTLRDKLCAELEKIETEYSAGGFSDAAAGKFERKNWFRNDDSSGESGGGEMSVIYGAVFEKAGVNFSAVRGDFPPEFAAQIPGTEATSGFYASGISVVVHPRSPLVPIAHMNTRHIITGKSWFGGGGDLTPAIPFDEDTSEFHQSFKNACDRFDPTYYDRFKQWCDEYFFIKHRNEARGVGGVFYDYLEYDNPEIAGFHFNFTQAIGEAFLEVYPKLVRKRMFTPWSEEDKRKQLVKRGRYVEFNLVYDRGTLFGLKTGGNIDAILMSLPPEAKWL